MEFEPEKEAKPEDSSYHQTPHRKDYVNQPKQEPEEKSD